MTWEILFVIALLIFALSSFILEKIPVDLTAMILFSAIILVSLISNSPFLPNTSDILHVFSSPAPLTIAAMFIVSAALERCGAIEIMASSLGKFAFLGYRGLLLALIIMVAFASAFMNNTAVVVVLLPVVLSISRKVKTPASKFLIPLSYASIFGGCCTAIGTSTNILVSGVLQDHGHEPLSMFELGKVGLPLLLIATVYLVIFGKKLLPVRETLTSILSEEERKEYIAEAFVKWGSEHVDKTLEESGLLKTQGLRVLEVIRNGIALQADLPSIILKPGDRLVLACRPSAMMKARSTEGFNFTDNMGLGLEQIAAHEGSLVEGVIGPHSHLVGRTIREINFRQRFRMVLLAVHRQGSNLREKLGTLRFDFGDTLLLMGTDVAIDSLRKDEDILLLDRPPLPAQDLRKKMPIALGVLAAIILAATFKLLPILEAALIGVPIIFITGCLKPKEGYEAIEWRILILIYGMLTLGMCMEKSGLSTAIAQNLVHLGENFFPGPLKPYAMLVILYLCTGLLTEVLTNNATAVLMAPIALGLAATLGVDPRPFIITTAIAASASFSTPIGYQTNTYVYGVGGYRFSDFWKIGLPLNLLYLTGTILIVTCCWKF